MAGVNGRYQSVIRGVSQQTPHDRRSGQMQSQDNFISDPVRGLARRWGTVLNASKRVHEEQLTPSELSSIASKFMTKSFFCDGSEYELIYTKQKVGKLDSVYCYDRIRNRFLDVAYSGQLATALRLDGVASMVNVGRFMFLAVNGVTPGYDETRNMPDKDQPRDGVIWVRQGTYSRKYTVTFRMQDGTLHTIEHQTLGASYPGILDTSSCPWDPADPGAYNKCVADKTNAYNTAVTQHITASTEDIQPPTIADKLAEKMRAAAGLANSQLDSFAGYVRIGSSSGIVAVSVTDGGDGTYMRSVFDTVDDLDKVSPLAYNGQVIRVLTSKQSTREAYYLRAEATAGNAFGEVAWRECPGIEYAPRGVMCLAWADGDTLFIGGSPGELNTMSGGRADAPEYSHSAVGDDQSSPLPYFLQGHQVNYLGLFQDRLLIVSGSVILASRPGDYLNWFRATILDVLDTDPVEMFAIGSEDDTIRWDSSFDRNHVLHGDRYQYIIPGRSVLSPKNPSIQIMSRIEDTTGAEPKTTGAFVFFAKTSGSGSSVHQLQMGASADSADSFECSQQLDTYLKGTPSQIVSMASPYMVILRTAGTSDVLYVYSYLDSMQGGERMFDSWSRWTWDPVLGPCCGISSYKERLIKFSLRTATDGVRMVAETANLDTELAPRPYLDSMIRYSDYLTRRNLWTAEAKARMYVALDNGVPEHLLGIKLSELETDMPEIAAPEFANNAWVGFLYDSVCQTTNPYILDSEGRSIINGRLTLSSLSVSVANSSGLEGYVETANSRKKVVTFEGRLLTRSKNLIGRVPILDTAVKVPVFREIRECQVEIRAVSWLPLTVSSIEWKGQFFNNLRRV